MALAPMGWLMGECDVAGGSPMLSYDMTPVLCPLERALKGSPH